jgi:Flp pilus assembly protein TadG
MIRLVKRFARDDRGASVIELALVMPFFATMIIGVADISRAYSAKLRLEQAAYRSIEKVQQYRDTSSTFSTISSEATTAATAAGFTSPTVVVDYFLECDGARQATYNTVCGSTTTKNRWITVDISGTFTPMFASSKWPGSNPDGTYTLHGKAGLRTQ